MVFWSLMSGEEELLAAVIPLLKLLSMGVIGLVLSHRRVEMLPRDTFRLLSKLVFALFLPCLIFTHLGPSITLANIARWWFLPVNIVLSTAIGCALGYMVALLCRPPPELFKFTVIATALGNTGNLPLAIVASVCHTETNMFGFPCYSDGIAYVSYSQWASFLLVYTLGYHMMEPPLNLDRGGSGDDEIQVEEEVMDTNTPLLVEAEWTGMEERETENCKTPLIARMFTGADVDPADDDDSSANKLVRRFRLVAAKTPIRNILQPPTIVTLLAVFIGSIPQIKWIVFGSSAPLSFITDSVDMVAEGMVPCAMLLLGGMLADGPSQSTLGVRTTIGIIVARLMLLPLIGIGVVLAADRLHILIPGDNMFTFVLLLQYTTPSAILLAAVASLRGHAVKEASALLFWQHLFALFSLSFYIIIYFTFVLPYL